MSLKKGVNQLWQEAMAVVETIDAATAVALHGREDVVFVDIRDIRELEREGIIPGAVHAPRGMLEYWVDPDSPYHREVFSSGKRFVLY
jgi:rhodanese-related sulfurtransferase